MRKSIRNSLERNIPILFLNDAQGDIVMDDLLNPISEIKEERLKRISKIVYDETMSLYKDVTFDYDPVLKHENNDLKVSVHLSSA